MIKRGSQREYPKEITINGVTIELLTKSQMAQFRINPKACWAVGGGLYAYTGNMNRHDLYKAAGYDINKVDMATPQPWFDKPEVQKRIKSGDFPAWSYQATRGKANYGKPVWDSEAKRKLVRMIKARMRR